MRIAVIPARGGSKRIPRKNIKLFCGAPMISRSIAIAKKSNLFDRIIVSTDDAEISAVAQEFGAEVPFVRPPNLADDHTGTTEVIAHATNWALEQGIALTSVCCIYATAPLIQIEDLTRGLSLLESGEWAYAFSATEIPNTVFRAFRQSNDGGVDMLFPQYFSTRSQDLPEVLQDAGQFYWGRPTAWLSGERIFDANSIPVIIPVWRVQDIDSQDDWQKAEQIYNKLEVGE